MMSKINADGMVRKQLTSLDKEAVKQVIMEHNYVPAEVMIQRKKAGKAVAKDPNTGTGISLDPNTTVTRNHGFVDLVSIDELGQNFVSIMPTTLNDPDIECVVSHAHIGHIVLDPNNQDGRRGEPLEVECHRRGQEYHFEIHEGIKNMHITTATCDTLVDVDWSPSSDGTNRTMKIKSFKPPPAPVIQQQELNEVIQGDPMFAVLDPTQVEENELESYVEQTPPSMIYTKRPVPPPNVTQGVLGSATNPIVLSDAPEPASTTYCTIFGVTISDSDGTPMSNQYAIVPFASYSRKSVYNVFLDPSSSINQTSFPSFQQVEPDPVVPMEPESLDSLRPLHKGPAPENESMDTNTRPSAAGNGGKGKPNTATALASGINTPSTSSAFMQNSPAQIGNQIHYGDPAARRLVRITAEMEQDGGQGKLVEFDVVGPDPRVIIAPTRKRKAPRKQTRPRTFKSAYRKVPTSFCGICGKSANDCHQLEVHFRTHTGEKPFQCLLCVVRFRQRPHLRKHYASVHKVDPEVMMPTLKKRKGKRSNNTVSRLVRLLPKCESRYY